MSNNATCSTINYMDIDVASNVADDVAANVASYVAGDDDVYMSMMWKVVLTWRMMWQVTSAPHPISGWTKFNVGHKLGPNISQPTINFQLTKFST